MELGNLTTRPGTMPRHFAAIFFAVIEQYLDADADAEKRRAGFRDVITEAFVEAERVEIFHGGAAPRRRPVESRARRRELFQGDR